MLSYSIIGGASSRRSWQRSAGRPGRWFASCSCLSSFSGGLGICRRTTVCSGQMEDCDRDVFHREFMHSVSAFRLFESSVGVRPHRIRESAQRNGSARSPSCSTEWQVIAGRDHAPANLAGGRPADPCRHRRRRRPAGSARRCGDDLVDVGGAQRGAVGPGVVAPVHEVGVEILVWVWAFACVSQLSADISDRSDRLWLRTAARGRRGSHRRDRQHSPAS